MEQEEPEHKRIRIEEQVTSGIEKKTEELSSFESLPTELKVYIISFLMSTKDEKEAIKNIKALSLTSKEFYNFINDPSVLGSLIEEVSKQFKKSPVAVAIAFSNFSAAKWLKGYIEQHRQEKKLLDMFLLGAIEMGESISAQFFLTAGADVNRAAWKDKKTLLQLASEEGNREIVELLLKHGADINQADDEGRTALFKVVNKGYRDIVKLLLDHGADVNKARIYGETPLHEPAAQGNNDIVELLLKAGADLNKTDLHGETPLHGAARKGKKDTIEILLKAGADVNAQANYGWTPIRLAASFGHQDIVELLSEFRDNK
jgi:ankyrin repeat protein